MEGVADMITHASDRNAVLAVIHEAEVAIQSSNPQNEGAAR